MTNRHDSTETARVTAAIKPKEQHPFLHPPLFLFISYKFAKSAIADELPHISPIRLLANRACRSPALRQDRANRLAKDDAPLGLQQKTNRK